MHPKTHILTSCLAVLMAAALSQTTYSEAFFWLVLAAAATLLIDADHFISQLLMKDRRPIVVDILKHPLDYMDTAKLIGRLHYPGFGILRVEYHLIETSVLTGFMLYYSMPYQIPVLLSLWVHCALDIIQVLREPWSR
ncbi:MAG: hypothetical protein V1744_03990 [Candidatus Altiarchaeota archaeon]